MAQDAKKQIEGKPVVGATTSLKPVEYARAASLGNATKTPKKSGQM